MAVDPPAATEHTQKRARAELATGLPAHPGVPPGSAAGPMAPDPGANIGTRRRDAKMTGAGHQHRYDVIVVGARCAGAATAMLLARRGLDVLLVDRARFPSEIPHGHYVHMHGPPRLADWGLLDRVLATGCPPITSITMDLGDFPLTGRGLVVDGVPVGVAPRRAALDKVLIDATVIRCVLLPATMAVLGERNWYLPRWLDRLPHLGVETESPRDIPVRTRSPVS